MMDLTSELEIQGLNHFSVERYNSLSKPLTPTVPETLQIRPKKVKPKQS